MFNETRNWKWMVPMGAAVVLLVLYGQTASWGAWSNIWLGLAIICGVAGMVNLGLYVYEHASQAMIDLRIATNSTPEVRMFEAAKGMHPDAVKYLLVQRRTLWRVRYVPASELSDWILDEAPNVHVGFVEFVLDHSSDTAAMPKSMLSQGAKQFDPDGIVTDYEQYDSLILLMQQKLYCTAAFGNQAPKWIAPWRPDLLRRRMGLDEGMMAEAEETVTNQSVERAEAWVEKNGSTSKDPIEAALGELEQTAWLRKQLEVSRK